MLYCSCSDLSLDQTTVTQRKRASAGSIQRSFIQRSIEVVPQCHAGSLHSISSSEGSS